MKIYAIQNYNYLNNYNPIKQSPRNTINIEQKPEAEYSKYSSDNLKANYIVNFKGRIAGEASSSNHVGALTYETHFFREPQTDEIVQDYILNNFSDYPEINIVSGACSTGEEAKSYAMMLDSLGDRLHIYGFDISDSVIQEAKKGTVKILINVDDSAITGIVSAKEKFLAYDNSPLTPYLQKCKDKFTTYFDRFGEAYKKPIYPDAQKQLDDLNAMMEDEERYEKEKNKYYEDIKEMKKAYAESGMEFDEVLNSILPFDDVMNLSIKALEEQIGKCYTYQDYKAKEGSFANCQFKQGDVLNLEQLYEPNSVNVLLYRNALYHTLCIGNSLLRGMSEDAQEKIDNIARQMNKVVAKDGLVVFGEEEWMQGTNIRVVETSMKNNGFQKLVQNGNEIDNIWVKVEDID